MGRSTGLQLETRNTQEGAKEVVDEKHAIGSARLLYVGAP
jgi:hypothetical protein